MDFQTDTPLLQAVMIGYEFGRRKMLDGSVGVRINRVNSIKGAVREARFARRALKPEEFLKAPAF
jgi:hypothetical protein